MLKVDVVDLVEVWLLVVNDIPKVVLVLEDVLRRIHKHFQLVGDENLQSYQEDLFLVIKDHRDVSEFQTFVRILLERNPVKLVICPSLVVVSPDLLLAIQNFKDMLL